MTGALPYRRGVGAALFNPRGLIFVGRRVDTPGDAWQLPQGGIRKRELPREAVLRELREEIGTDRAEIVAEVPEWLTYDLPPHLVGQVWGGRYRGQRQRWFALRFTGRDSDIDLAAEGHAREFDAWRWVGLSTLPQLAVPFKRALYARLVTEFAPLVARLLAATGDADHHPP